MLFKELAAFFLKLENTDSRLQMTEILAELFQKTEDSEIDRVCYLLQGRVVPQYQKLDFVLAERMIFRSLITAFSISENQAKQRFQEIGDLGKLAEKYRQTTNTLFQTNKDLTVGEVFEKLTKLCLLSGAKSQEAKMGQVIELLQNLDPLSCRYLVRIISNKLRLGFSDMTILDAFSWMLRQDKSLRLKIEEAYNVEPDLGLIGKILKEKGITGISKIQPKVGVPILMAKAERVANPQEIINNIGACSVEPKYDGFRLQFHYHRRTKLIKIFSRGMEDTSFMFPDLAKAIEKELPVDEIIFEGEAVGFDSEKKSYLPFQETVQRKRKHDILETAERIPLRVFSFDLLLLNGKSFIQETYEKRRFELAKLLKADVNSIFKLTEASIAESAKKISQLFVTAVDKGLEGIMAKKLSGTYQAGARNWNWIKFKHSYDSKLIDTIDCVVMGYDFGQGKRTNFGIGAFLVGILDNKTEEFVTVAKIGTGLTDEEWKLMAGYCQKNKVSEKPKEYRVNKQLIIDNWVAPKIVVEIRADEITKSTMHTANENKDGIGLALRFPRLERFRDKLVNEVTTVSELIKIFQKQRLVNY